MFGYVGKLVRNVGRSVELYREANAIASTPENVFRARGTTRDKVLRDLVSRI